MNIPGSLLKIVSLRGLLEKLKGQPLSSQDQNTLKVLRAFQNSLRSKDLNYKNTIDPTAAVQLLEAHMHQLKGLPAMELKRLRPEAPVYVFHKKTSVLSHCAMS